MRGVLGPAVELWTFGSPGGLQIPNFSKCWASPPHLAKLGLQHVSQHYFVVLSLCALFLHHLFILFVFLFFHLYCFFLQLSPQVFIAFAPNVRIDSHYVLLIVSHHIKEKIQDLVFCALICCFSCNSCTSSSPFFYLHYIVGFFVVLREFMIFKLWVFFQSFPSFFYSPWILKLTRFFSHFAL